MISIKTPVCCDQHPRKSIFFIFTKKKWDLLIIESAKVIVFIDKNNIVKIKI